MYEHGNGFRDDYVSQWNCLNCPSIYGWFDVLIKRDGLKFK